ncbi:hypothetical protein N0V90_013139 [Kalmusia sp. IMI 367209]|nr:hypothetical protein N0V90_013139 [Kalmusia sp. IMI 367209]
MAYVQYRSTRERSPIFDDEDLYYTRPLVRRNSKRARADLYDDDEFDDYPYSNNKSKPSRALTIRQPSQIEKYNVWSRPSASKHGSKYYSKDTSDDDNDQDRTVRYKYTTTRYSPVSRSRSDDEDERDREREFRLKVKATFGRPKSSHSSERKAMAWSGDLFRRKEKWENEDWETRERERRDSVFDDEPVREKTVRFRRIKRTRTDEWKPLSGWRRS